MASAPDPAFLREAVMRMGLTPDSVDLEWIARIMAQTEEVIRTLRSESGFASAEPLFCPERQPGREIGG